MTDNEIIKALECSVNGKCPECPYFHSYPCDKCRNMRKDALDLINRLKADIERLKESLNIELENYATEYDNKIKAEAYKELAKKVYDKRQHTVEGECVIYEDDFFKAFEELGGKVSDVIDYY